MENRPKNGQTEENGKGSFFLHGKSVEIIVLSDDYQPFCFKDLIFHENFNYNTGLMIHRLPEPNEVKAKRVQIEIWLLFIEGKSYILQVFVVPSYGLQKLSILKKFNTKKIDCDKNESVAEKNKHVLNNSFNYLQIRL